MARLRGKEKIAFLRRMAAGRKRASRVGVKRRVRRRRRNPYAVIANPTRYPLSVNSNPKRKARKMAKRRRKPRRRIARRRRPATRRVIRRRRRRSSPVTRRRRYRRRPRMTARRAAIYVNPRRRRRVRRRRNPGFNGSFIKRTFTPLAIGFATSVGLAALDTGLVKYPVVAKLVKIGAAFVIAFTGRKYPIASTAAISAIGSCFGYPLGVKLVGGMVAKNPEEAVKGLAGMTRTYPQMGALLNGGVGALLSGMGDAPSNLPDVVRDYQTALDNIDDD